MGLARFMEAYTHRISQNAIPLGTEGPTEIIDQ